jgi:prepilin-type N-terminal cleavage/methylation domain-containing protein
MGLILSRKASRGFTLVEITVAVVLLAIIGAFAAEYFGSAQALRMRTERREKLETVAATIQNAMIANVGLNTAYGGPAFIYGWVMLDASAALTHPQPFNSTLNNVYVQDFGANKVAFLMPYTSLTESSAFYLSSYIPAGYNTNVFDDFGNRFFLVNGSLKTVEYRGHTLSVPVTYVVSAGANGRLETAMDPSAMTLVGDDIGATIDLTSAYTKGVDDAYDRLRQIKGNLERLYQARYLADSTRDPMRNYFSPPPSGNSSVQASMWDAGSPLPVFTYGATVTTFNQSLATAIGMSKQDLALPFGFPEAFTPYFGAIASYPQFQFSGSPLREPTLGSQPPYNVQIAIRLPYIAAQQPSALAVSTY